MTDTQKNKTQILIGTSGYSYPDWQQVFYPPELAKKDWLAFYAEHFNFCELNFSYYRMPQPKQMESYLKQPLKYAIKGHRSMTHDRIESLAPVEDFVQAVQILHEGEKLAAVLLQFPYSFAYTDANRLYLHHLLTALGHLPVVVEFRSPHWIRDSVLEGLKAEGWGICMLDSPNVQGGMPQFHAVSSDIAYLRFHGRNQAQWWKGDNVSRYDYEYTPEELQEWIPRIQRMATEANTTYIAFNNHARGQAIKNANQIKTMLRSD